MTPILLLIMLAALFVVVTIGFGLLFSFVNTQNSKAIQRNFGWGGICFFGWIGVPVHELSHLVMAVLFGHKITNVSLFRPKKGRVDGILGYVRHSYRNKLIQKMGNFFIGAAPMVVGAVLLRTMIVWLSPTGEIPVMEIKDTQAMARYVMEIVRQVGGMFQTEQLEKVWFWLLLIVMIGIAVNMNMSTADVKNSLHGIISLFVITALVGSAFHYFAGMEYEAMALVSIGWLVQYVSVLVYGLVICLMILLLMRLISYFI